MKRIGSIGGGHLGEQGRCFKSILFESKSFPRVFKHPSVGWSKSADGVYKKKKFHMEWSLDGDAESRKTLSEMCYLRKSWGTGRICKMKAQGCERAGLRHSRQRQWLEIQAARSCCIVSRESIWVQLETRSHVWQRSETVVSSQVMGTGFGRQEGDPEKL